MRALLALLFAAVLLGAASWYLWLRHQDRLPAGIAAGNGRLEAQEIDIAARYAGRIAAVLADEGDPVEAGQVLARMDTKAIEASLEAAEARARQARESARQAAAETADARSRVSLARQELERDQALLEKGFVSGQRIAQRRTDLETAEARLAAADAHYADVTEAVSAAASEARRIRVELEEATLNAPRGGRVLYRLAEPGEILPAGGKILTIVDLDDVYMTLFLPAADAGRVRIGADARIRLDALPERAFRARVTFVASEAQFTPKEVETASEREKLVFRVKAQLTEREPTLLKPGMPGMAYVRLDAAAEWPDWLK
jgi:HlyD family secretion protein